jgi:hypothetical protein
VSRDGVIRFTARLPRVRSPEVVVPAPLAADVVNP